MLVASSSLSWILHSQVVDEGNLSPMDGSTSRREGCGLPERSNLNNCWQQLGWEVYRQLDWEVYRQPGHT